MRISVRSWQTSDEDIDAIVSAVERVVATAANQVAVPHPIGEGLPVAGRNRTRRREGSGLVEE